MKRRAAGMFLAFMVLAAAAALGGCGDDDAVTTTGGSVPGETTTSAGASTTEPTTETTGEATSTTGEPARRVAIIGLGEEPVNLNAAVQFGAAGTIAGKIMEGLVVVNETMTEASPALATDWTVSPDGLIYEFHLREGVQWHDGEPFTSADVKWSFENLNINHTIGRRCLSKVTSIETPDDYTVILTLSQPYGPMLLCLGESTGGAIAPKHIGEAAEDPLVDLTLNTAPIGTGPFKFEEWVAGERVTMVRNDDYWGGAPWLEGITVLFVPSATTAKIMLENGELDFTAASVVNREDLAELGATEGLTVNQIGVPGMVFLIPNHQREPLNSLDVRKALYMAIDRQFILQTAFAGVGDVARSIIPADLPVANVPEIDVNVTYPYDVEAANALLDAAGYPRGGDGVRFDLGILPYPAGRQGVDVAAEAVCAMWEQIGVTCVAQAQESAVLAEAAFMNRDFNVVLMSYATNGDPELGVARAIACEPEPVNYGNPTGYCNPTVDELLAEAAQGVTFEARHEAYAEAQYVLLEDLPVLQLYSDPNAFEVLNTGLWDFSAVLKVVQCKSGWAWAQVQPAAG